MCPTSSTRRSTRRAITPGDTAKLFIKAPFAGEAELAIASDRVLSLRSMTLPAGRHHARHPGRCRLGQRRLRAGQRLSPVADAPGPQQRGPGRAVGVAWLGIDPSAAHARARRWPRPMSCGRAARSRSRSRSPVSRRRGGLRHPRRGRRGGAEADRFRQPGAGEILFRQAPARGRIARSLWPADRCAGGGVGVLRSGGDQFAKRSVAGLPDKSSRVVALFSGIVRLDGDGAAPHPVRHSRFPGPAAADGGGVFGAQGRLGHGRDDGARPGRDDGGAAALSRARRYRADRGHDQQSRRRSRRLSPDLIGDRRRAVRRAGRPHGEARRRRQVQRRLHPVGDDDRQCRAASRPDRARRSEDRARFHDRGAAGAVLPAAPLCRAAAAGPERHARRWRGRRVPARHGGGAADRQPAPRLGRSRPAACARPLCLWLSRADDEPRVAAALCR